MKPDHKLERAALALLLLAIIYLVSLNHQLRNQTSASATHADVTALSGTSNTQNLGPASSETKDDEHLELLRLRGQVAQLTCQLNSRVPLNQTGSTAATPATNSESDTQLFTAATTNNIRPGNTLIVGGWSSEGLRTYLLITPTPVAGTSPGQDRFSMKSYVVRAPDSVWSELGWGDAASDTRRSKLAATLTPDETDALLSTLTQNKQNTVSSTAPSEISSGGHIGFAFSVDDEQGVGVLMSVEVYPRAVPGLIELGVTPSPPSDKVPIHHSLKRFAVR